MKKKTFDNLTIIMRLMFVLYNMSLTFAHYFRWVTDITGVVIWFALLIPNIIMWYISILNKFVTVRGGRSFFEEK